MKNVILLLLVFTIFLSSCRKNDDKGYRINNLSGCDLIITTPKETYIIETTKSIFFISSSEPTFSLSDENLKIKIYEIGTSPQRTFNISSYLHNFEVKVRGVSDSVKISINGIYFNEKVPFYYGTDNEVNSYQVNSQPYFKEHTFTMIYSNGDIVNYSEGDCILNGDL